MMVRLMRNEITEKHDGMRIDPALPLWLERELERITFYPRGVMCALDARLCLLFRISGDVRNAFMMRGEHHRFGSLK